MTHALKYRSPDIARAIIMLSMVLSTSYCYSQEFIPLWSPAFKPNSNGKKLTDTLYNERIWRVGTPGIYAFVVPASESKGTAILICPGGGYERLSHIYNGFNLAKWYNSIGVSAFVLIYRLPHQEDLVKRQIAPVQDAQRAMRIIRANATKWNIKGKVGVMGTSAGGHVASMLGNFTTDLSAVKDSIDAFAYRPDFMVLLSPVISMGKYAHKGSKRHLLGPDTSNATIEKYSMELQVTPSTPLTFIIHALNDSTVNVHNSMLFYQALLDKKVNASIHIFPQGGHGIRLDDNPGSTDLWMNLLELWLKETGCITTLPFK